MVLHNQNERFSKIDTERLNIVDKSGKVRLSLFNDDNIPPAIMDGVDILPGHRKNDPISGLMFYNAEGDECGGLIYGNEVKENGDYSAFASLTFDQYKQDQVVQMRYVGENGNHNYGFAIFDRPNKNLGEMIKRTNQIEKSDLTTIEKEEAIEKEYAGSVQRAYMGKAENGDISVQLMDSKGNSRIRMVVDENDIPKLEFLDEKGKVTYKLPPD
ncbi:MULTISPECIES: hypothetical protein [unclassified Psychrobacillus]|uniref:hypothetical protein n=1 Tax=unclassified Psychrobacillus TaxID=2636677 RepID=UPI00146C34E3|nr:hypothetical protein [Psychrobacillus sp. BL-248-WT-3]NME05325.1 hypothetical protein [Psychrobacillus sp. BL-248-WT-3]